MFEAGLQLVPTPLGACAKFWGGVAQGGWEVLIPTQQQGVGYTESWAKPRSELEGEEPAVQLLHQQHSLRVQVHQPVDPQAPHGGQPARIERPNWRVNFLRQIYTHTHYTHPAAHPPTHPPWMYGFVLRGNSQTLKKWNTQKTRQMNKSRSES